MLFRALGAAKSFMKLNWDNKKVRTILVTIEKTPEDSRRMSSFLLLLSPLSYYFMLYEAEIRRRNSSQSRRKKKGNYEMHRKLKLKIRVYPARQKKKRTKH